MDFMSSLAFLSSHPWLTQTTTNAIVQQAIECVVDKNIQRIGIKALSLSYCDLASRNESHLCQYRRGIRGGIKNVMLYGHFDNQFYGPGWEEGLTTTDLQIREDFMYIH